MQTGSNRYAIRKLWKVGHCFCKAVLPEEAQAVSHTTERALPSGARCRSISVISMREVAGGASSGALA